MKAWGRVGVDGGGQWENKSIVILSIIKIDFFKKRKHAKNSILLACAEENLSLG